MALSAKMKAYLRFAVTESDSGAGVGAAASYLHHVLEFGETTYANGTAANQVNRVYSADLTITTSATDLDLDALTAMDGSTITFAEIVAVVVLNNSTTTGEDIVVGGDANAVPIFSAANDSIKVEPSGLFAWLSPVDGATVTASTGDILQLVASSGSISAEVLIVGRTS